MGTDDAKGEGKEADKTSSLSAPILFANGPSLWRGSHHVLAHLRHCRLSCPQHVWKPMQHAAGRSDKVSWPDAPARDAAIANGVGSVGGSRPLPAAIY
jgi:hypothetical protein